MGRAAPGTPAEASGVHRGWKSWPHPHPAAAHSDPMLSTSSPVGLDTFPDTSSLSACSHALAEFQNADPAPRAHLRGRAREPVSPPGGPDVGPRLGAPPQGLGRTGNPTASVKACRRVRRAPRGSLSGWPARHGAAEGHGQSSRGSRSAACPAGPRGPPIRRPRPASELRLPISLRHSRWAGSLRCVSPRGQRTWRRPPANPPKKGGGNRRALPVRRRESMLPRWREDDSSRHPWVRGAI